MEPDWLKIDIPTFDDVIHQHAPRQAASLAVFDRLPFAFDSKEQYLSWRDHLSQGFEVDGRDIALVGSAATGRSLSARKRFGVFGASSDIDVGVVSSHHFDIAWKWFRLTDPLTLTGLDQTGKDRFEQHRKHYVYEGIIAADYFLSFLPFGGEWLKAMQRSQDLLPAALKGRLMKVRIYKDYSALRDHQAEAIRIYKLALSAKREGKAQ